MPTRSRSTNGGNDRRDPRLCRDIGQHCETLTQFGQQVMGGRLLGRSARRRLHVGRSTQQHHRVHRPLHPRLLLAVAGMFQHMQQQVAVAEPLRRRRPQLQRHGRRPERGFCARPPAGGEDVPVQVDLVAVDVLEVPTVATAGEAGYDAVGRDAAQAFPTLVVQQRERRFQMLQRHQRIDVTHVAQAPVAAVRGDQRRTLQHQAGHARGVEPFEELGRRTEPQLVLHPRLAVRTAQQARLLDAQLVEPLVEHRQHARLVVPDQLDVDGVEPRSTGCRSNLRRCVEQRSQQHASSRRGIGHCERFRSRWARITRVRSMRFPAARVRPKFAPWTRRRTTTSGTTEVRNGTRRDRETQSML